MERWSGRVVIVTGAGSGIGEAIAESLVKHGLKVVGVDFQNYGKVEDNGQKLMKDSGRLYALKADVTKDEDVLEVFKWIKKNLGGVDILVNCAGSYELTPFSDLNMDLVRRQYNVNVLGLTMFTKEAIASMKERGVDDGHIVNIDSICGHIPPTQPANTQYTATKHAVRVISEGLRRELVQQKSKIRVTNISPGLVNTNMIIGAGFTDCDLPKLNPEDIADAVIYALSAPPHVQIHEITLHPVGEDLF